MTGVNADSVAIGKAVHSAFVQAGMPRLTEAAAELPMPINTLSRRVNGLIPFTWPELVRVAEVTGVSVTDLAASAVRIADAGEAVPV